MTRNVLELSRELYKVFMMICILKRSRLFCSSFEMKKLNVQIEFYRIVNFLSRGKEPVSMLSFGGDDEDALRKALLIGGGVSLVASLAGAGYYVYNRWVYNPTVTGEVSTRFVQRPIWGEDGPGKEKRKKSSLPHASPHRWSCQQMHPNCYQCGDTTSGKERATRRRSSACSKSLCRDLFRETL